MIRHRWRPSIFVDAFGYASERVGRLVLAAIVGIFVARYLGPRGYGLLNFATAVFALLGPLSLLGMEQILLREFSTTGNWRAILWPALRNQAVAAAIVSVAGALVIVTARGFERDAVLLALVMFPVPFLALSESVRAYLEAVGRVRRILVTGLLAALVASSLKVAGLVFAAPVWAFGAIVTAELAVILGGLLDGLPREPRATPLRRETRREVARQLRQESWPLLLAALAVTVYTKADLLMLGVLSGDRETGLYAAAARLSEVWYFIPVSAAAAVRPRLARMFAAGEFLRYRASTQQFMTAAVGVSLIVLAVVVVTADRIIGLLYGPEFLEASLVLRIHILSAPFVFLGVAGSHWFIDRGMTRAVMVRSSAGALLNVVMNLLLIPRFGAVGASIATLAAYASGVLINVLPAPTRPLFWLQMRAFLFKWPRAEGSDEPTSATGRSDP